MGIFNKKKKIDAPPLMDVPSPVNISSGADDHLFGEPDIPHISSVDMPNFSNQKMNDNMDEAPLPDDLNDVEVPLPPSNSLSYTDDLNDDSNLSNDNSDEDLPPLPPNQPKIPSMNESSPIFPEMNESELDSKQDMAEPQSNILPFEHSYDDMPNEQELKEAFAPQHSPLSQHSHLQGHKNIPDYDKFLELRMSASSRPKFFENKQYFLSLSEYKYLMSNLNELDVLSGNQVDTTLRLTSIQEEKSTRYDKYQHELEMIHNQFAKLDNLIFN